MTYDAYYPKFVVIQLYIYVLAKVLTVQLVNI